MDGGRNTNLRINILEILIEITDIDEKNLLVNVAVENGLTVTAYATNIVRGWLQGRIKNDYIGYVKGLDISKLKDKLGDHTKLKET